MHSTDPVLRTAFGHMPITKKLKKQQQIQHSALNDDAEQTRENNARLQSSSQFCLFCLFRIRIKYTFCFHLNFTLQPNANVEGVWSVPMYFVQYALRLSSWPQWIAYRIEGNKQTDVHLFNSVSVWNRGHCRGHGTRFDKTYFSVTKYFVIVVPCNVIVFPSHYRRLAFSSIFHRYAKPRSRFGLCWCDARRIVRAPAAPTISNGRVAMLQTCSCGKRVFYGHLLIP